MKICSKCDVSKQPDEFYSDKTKIDSLNVRCKDCIKQYRAQNKEQINRRRKEKGFKYPNKNKSQRIYRETLKGKLTAWKYAAKTRGINWNLTLEELQKLPMSCYYTNIALVFDSNKLNTVSLDRLDSQKDYSQENVVFCCEIINKMKQTLSVDEFVEFCQLVVKNKKNIKSVGNSLKVQED
jgi:hypothetical protein